MKKITLCLIFVSSLLFTACNNKGDGEHYKGDGEHFYLEFDEERGLVYHSLPSCSKIETGVRRDDYDLNCDEKSKSKTCPKCMDDDLIDKLEKKIY